MFISQSKNGQSDSYFLHENGDNVFTALRML